MFSEGQVVQKYRHFFVSAFFLLLTTWGAFHISSCQKKDKHLYAIPKEKGVDLKDVISGKTVQKIAQGQKLIVLARSKQKQSRGKIKAFWFKVKTPKNKMGWIYGGDVTIRFPANATYKVVAGSVVDIHFLNKSLVYAAQFDNVKEVQKLLDRGAEINGYNKQGDTALLEAAGHRNEKVVAFLLKRGADANLRSRSVGRTPLMRQMLRPSLSIAKKLIKHGAKIELTDKFGNTALLEAAYYADLEYLTFLLQKGADVKAVNKDGQNALLRASGSVKGRDVIGAVQLLVQKGLSVSSRDNYLNTPLIRASYLWNEKAVAFFLQKGADVHHKNKGGETPLQAAASGHWFGQRDIRKLKTTISLLFQKGAKVKVRSNTGNSPLTWATHNNHFFLVKQLVEKGAHLDHQTGPRDIGCAGCSSLMIAAVRGRLEILRYLLSKGANRTLKDAKGQDILALAKKKKHAAIIKELLKK